MAKALGLVLALCLAAAGARADEPPDVERARLAYEAGAAAYDRGDYAGAAAAFALADELAPNSVALGTALKAAVLADDAALGMTLAERAEPRAATDPALADAAAGARAAFAGRTGRVALECGARAPCSATLDGSVLGEPRWVIAGEHQVAFRAGAFSETRMVVVEPGARATLTPSPPTLPPPPPAPPPAALEPGGGVSPAWFWVTGGVTVVLGAVTIGSAIDWRIKRDQFLEDPTEEGSVEGIAVENRTNALIGVTAGGVVATAVLGLFVVRWSGTSPGVVRATPDSVTFAF